MARSSFTRVNGIPVCIDAYPASSYKPERAWWAAHGTDGRMKDGVSHTFRDALHAGILAALPNSAAVAPF